MDDQKRQPIRSMTISRLFRANEIGISIPEPHTWRAVSIFLDIASPAGGKAIAPRVTQMRRGVLLFQMIEGEPASGSIYIYDRETGDFYSVCFDGIEDDRLTLVDFEDLAKQYDLLELASQVGLLTHMLTPPIQAPGRA